MPRLYYTSKTKNACRKLFVEDEWSRKEISRKYKNKPTAQTVINWSRESIDGRETWEEELDRRRQEKYSDLSPQSQLDKILQRINFLLAKDVKSFNTKDADALSKMQKFMEKIVDKKFQIPMLYELLTKFIEFLKKQYPDLMNEEFVNASRHFKNQLVEELNDPRN